MLQNVFLPRLNYNVQLRRFYVTIVALGFTIDGVYSVILNLYMLRLGFDTTLIGAVNAIGLLTFALMSLPAGLLGTKWTSSQLLRVGFGMILGGAILLPLVEFLPHGLQPIWLIVTYALVLSGWSMYFVNSAPFVMAIVSQDDQNSAFAMQTAFLSLSAFAGSLIGGNLPEGIVRITDFTLSDPQPYRYALMLVSVVTMFAFLVTLTIHELSESEQDELAAASTTPALITGLKGKVASSVIAIIVLMSVVRFFQVAGIGTMSVYLNVYLDTGLSISPGKIGFITAVGRLIAVPTVLIAPALARKLGTGNVAMWGSLGTVGFLMVLALVPTWWAAGLGYAGANAVTNLRFTAFIVYILNLVPKHRRSLITGMGEMAAGFSFALMALGGGYMLVWFSFRDLFLLGAGLSFIGTLIFWMHLRSQTAQPQLTVDTVAIGD